MCRQIQIALFFFLSLLSFSSHPARGDNAAPPQPEEQLRQLFKTSTKKETAPKRAASCTTISRGPKTNLAETAPTADALIAKIMKAIDADTLNDLIPSFHPRLKAGLEQMAEASQNLKKTLGAPVKASIYRLWLLDTVDGSPLDLPCDEGEFLVSTHYGYEFSLGIWLQVMGKGELGRLFVSLVPKDGALYIGAWHLHQWTHLGQDSVAWQEKVAKFSSDARKPSAFLLQDIALKLLDQKVFVMPQAANPVQEKRDKILSLAEWEKQATSLARTDAGGSTTTTATSATPASPATTSAAPFIPEITAIRTALAQDGAGVSFYARVPEEISANDFEAKCLTVAKRFFSAPAWQGVDGVKCHFLMPGEAADQEGRLGGMYFGKAQIAAIGASAKKK